MVNKIKIENHVGADVNPYMEAVNEHCISLVDIMKKGDFSFAELKQLQLRFRSLDALLENVLHDVREDLKETQEEVLKEVKGKKC